MSTTIRTLAPAIALWLALAAPAWAQTSANEHAAHHTPSASAPAASASSASTASAPMADGEVRRIDKAGQKLTLRHGEIRNLEMPPMTMVFRVQDARLLDGLAVGDKVKFVAAQVNGQYVVTAIQK